MSKLRYISFIHLFSYLLSKYYVPGTIPGDRGYSSEHTKNLALMKFIVKGGGQTINKQGNSKL